MLLWKLTRKCVSSKKNMLHSSFDNLGEKWYGIFYQQIYLICTSIGRAILFMATTLIS